MIRIRTPSRLHFGLFSLPSAHATDWLNHEGAPILPRRQYGGVGLMIDKPGIELTIAKADHWSAEGPLGQRAMHFAHAYCDQVGVLDAFHVQVESVAQEHAGLGTGTQLGLAVARAIAELTNQPERDAVTLARHVGRGRRSAIGVHGFEQGGFIVEGGKTSDECVSPLLVRCPFPWNVILITPRDLGGVHGPAEIDAFAELEAQEPDDRATETLCRLVLLGLLPALIEQDLTTFGEALYDFNRRAGEMFRRAQGGLYAHPRIEEIVRSLRLLGIKGVGQSSWGPTVFAVVSAGQALELGAWLMRKKKAPRRKLDDCDVTFTSACNRLDCLANLDVTATR
jgi:beta-ribofuranosylaminobenzene 5'-phosphate synthase